MAVLTTGDSATGLLSFLPDSPLVAFTVLLLTARFAGRLVALKLARPETELNSLWSDYGSALESCENSTIGHYSHRP